MAIDQQLQLAGIRQALIRLEETIIFSLIERAQFCRNALVYRKGGLGPALGDESLLDFMLHECERSHAKVRRYTSPDEHPFFHDLPDPILPPLAYDQVLAPGKININPRIRVVYENEIVPLICPPGDDRQYGSSAVNDVGLLQGLSKRIHYGKFVAESKCRASPGLFVPLIQARDTAGLLAAITDPAVETAVLERVLRKAHTYTRELEPEAGFHTVDPETVRDIYARWVIPLNKEVQVLYLLQREA